MIRPLLAALLFALATWGCTGESSPSTFGLQYRYSTTHRTVGTGCILSGNARGAESQRLDPKGGDLSDRSTRPHLWLQIAQEGGDAPYVVEVFSVSDYAGSTMVPTTKQLLSTTSYGQDFADAATSDTVHVSFEGEDYDIEVRGVRDGASSCAPWE